MTEGLIGYNPEDTIYMLLEPRLKIGVTDLFPSTLPSPLLVILLRFAGLYTEIKYISGNFLELHVQKQPSTLPHPLCGQFGRIHAWLVMQRYLLRVSPPIFTHLGSHHRLRLVLARTAHLTPVSRPQSRARGRDAAPPADRLVARMPAGPVFVLRRRVHGRGKGRGHGGWALGAGRRVLYGRRRGGDSASSVLDDEPHADGGHKGDDGDSAKHAADDGANWWGAGWGWWWRGGGGDSGAGGGAGGDGGASAGGGRCWCGVQGDVAGPAFAAYDGDAGPVGEGDDGAVWVRCVAVCGVSKGEFEGWGGSGRVIPACGGRA